jgi:hypothetical protein
VTETREPVSSRQSLRDQSFRFTDAIGRLIRASTEAATEVTVGVVRATTGVVSGVTKSVADNINTTVSDFTGIAQQGIDRFFSVLDSGTRTEEKPASEATPADEDQKF